MWPSDLNAIFSKLNNLNPQFNFSGTARPFIYQEVIDLGKEAISTLEYVNLGAVTEFKYSVKISNVFKGRDKLKYLENWGEAWDFMKSNQALVFVDNHDNQRGHGAAGEAVLTYKNAKQYKMAIAFMLAHPYGTPRIMSSFFFDNSDTGPPKDTNETIKGPVPNAAGVCDNGWVCEHRWRQIYNMIAFRNTVKENSIKNWWSNDDQQIAFCRGNLGFIAFTNHGNIAQKLQTCLPKGTYCDVISGEVDNTETCTGKTVTVREDGYGYISLAGCEEDGVLAIHVNAKQR